jgi:hypothetical protein
MGTVTKIDARKLAPELIARAEKTRGALGKAAIAAARKFCALLVQKTDEMGITDTGALKNSWRAEKLPGGGATVYSDCPYAGIVELGARPHPVSQAGQDAIASWAIRKLGVSDKEAKSVAFLICRKIAREGQAPRYLVQNQLPKAIAYFKEELERIINQ